MRSLAGQPAAPTLLGGLRLVAQGLYLFSFLVSILLVLRLRPFPIGTSETPAACFLPSSFHPCNRPQLKFGVVYCPGGAQDFSPGLNGTKLRLV
jgi:hypothetical protein